ncbi:Vitamin B12 transporter BtuB [Flavobacterium bizetiae]|uniref:Vitamin B12 transporter BtuB n=1 Tax=Flavobacterium bizetiae TaxID=2704140 RepID=A0A6J4GNI3_9FLAO|nr:TonB-dependent receptor [Flavobacterium bizetiae]CAA9200453.1 Vitamin B12 transporter BtuB [Flavobacterium bizetiae]CAD5340597.1 Vitamin B12 transporter BtuB [Flavobacterium bizetiae]CAD5346731.1 Vitamin B12 transporter BtuB [Flavobacterium bizetiae]
MNENKLDRLRAFLLLFCCFAIVTKASAQSVRISGSVFSDGHKPLDGAIVTIFPSSINTITDKKGHFFFTQIPKDSKKITVSYSGHSVYEMGLSLDKNEILLSDIFLHPEAKQLQEVVITENYESRKKKQESLNIESVNSSFIQRNLGGSLMQSLQRLPGVKTISIGSGGSKPLIRGLSFNQVIVVENGIKHEGQQWGADHGLEIDQYAVNRVEIIKGPSSFMYGSDAIGGAINIKPVPFPAQHVLGGSVDFTGKSNNEQFGGSFNFFGRNEKWFFDTRITAMDYGDYRVPTDIVQVYNYTVPLYKNHLRNTAGRELDLHGSLGYVTDRFKSVFYVSNIYTKSGFFANAHGLEPRNVDTELHDKSSRDILMPHQEVTHTKISNTTSFSIGTHKLETQLGFQQNFRREWSHYVNHGFMPPLYPDDMYAPKDLERQYDKEVFSVAIKDEFSLGQHQFTVGLNGEQQQNAINGWSFLIPAFKQSNAGLFVYDKFQLNDLWLLHGAIRLDHGQIEMKEYYDWFQSEITENGQISQQYLKRSQELTRSFNSFNWSAGVNYTPGQWSLKANLGTSFRMPIAKELASNGVNYHYFRFEKGDPNLSAERSYQLDLGIDWQENKWSVQLSPFFNYFPNYIYLNPTSQHDIYYGAGNQVFEYEQSKVMRYGGEFSTRYQFLKNLSGEILAEYLYSEQMSGSKKGYTLPFSPPASVLFGLTYNPEIKHLKDTYFSLDYRYTAQQNQIVPPEKKTASSNVFNLAMGTKAKAGQQDFIISLQVQNLFNAKYLNHTSFYRLIELPEASRNIILSVKIPFLIHQ